MNEDDKSYPTARGRGRDDDDQGGSDLEEPPRLLVGEPFAMSYDCELFEQPEPAVVVRCKCGKPFRLLLLEAGNKPCPHCQQEYTHLLLVCTVEDDQAFNGVLEHIADVNPVSDDAGEDDESDDAGEDDESDDESNDE